MDNAQPPDEGRVQSLDELLTKSRATDAFKTGVREFAHGKPHTLIGVNRWQPDVKVLRTICKLLEEHPDHPIERVDIEGASGCSDYVGTMAVQPGDLQITLTGTANGRLFRWGGPTF